MTAQPRPATPSRTARFGAVIAFATAVAALTALSGSAMPAVAHAQTASATVVTWETLGNRFGGVEWVTRPSQDAVMTFGGPIEIRKILARGGERVKQGQTLIQGRDDEQVAALEVQRVRSANDTEVRTAEANLELAKSRFDAAVEAKAKEALNPSEYDERRIGYKAAQINLESAQQKLKEEVLRTRQIEEQIKRYRLDAPFDGIVQEVLAEVGQTTDERAPVIRVIRVDPVYVDVPVRTDQTLALNLRPGSSAWVLLDVPGEPVVLAGKVLYVSPGADSASGTRRVRVEAANGSEWPTGTRARVRFAAPAGDWASTPAPGEPSTVQAAATGARP